jgi:hypothetical protein
MAGFGATEFLDLRGQLTNCRSEATRAERRLGHVSAPQNLQRSVTGRFASDVAWQRRALPSMRCLAMTSFAAGWRQDRPSSGAVCRVMPSRCQHRMPAAGRPGRWFVSPAGSGTAQMGLKEARDQALVPAEISPAGGGWAWQLPGGALDGSGALTINAARANLVEGLIAP